MRWLALGLLIPLAGCTPPIVKPEIVYIDRPVYVAIPAGLTNPHPVAEGPLAHCPMVAAARKAEIEACNADKAAIRSVQAGPPPVE